MLVSARVNELAVGGHQVHAAEVVDGQAVRPGEVALAAAERESGDPGRRDEAAGRREPERLRLGVHVAPGCTRADRRGPGGRTDPDRIHRAEVEHQAAVAADRGPGEAVTAALDRERQLVLAGERDPGNDVGGAHTTHDTRGVSVDHAVPDRSGVGVPVVAR